MMDEKDKPIKGKHMLITMRCIDMAACSYDVGKRPCRECGEMTWVSSPFKGKEMDIICEPCYLRKHNNDDEHNVLCVTEECIEEAIKLVAEVYHKIVTREEMIESLEHEIGKKISIRDINK